MTNNDDKYLLKNNQEQNLLPEITIGDVFYSYAKKKFYICNGYVNQFMEVADFMDFKERVEFASRDDGRGFEVNPDLLASKIVSAISTQQTILLDLANTDAYKMTPKQIAILLKLPMNKVKNMELIIDREMDRAFTNAAKLVAQMGKKDEKDNESKKGRK